MGLRKKLPKILVIDNYDSFTYNLVQYIAEKYPKIEIFRNDKITLGEIRKAKYNLIVISPGPGTPRDGGISISLIQEFHKLIPILGVCLGHQSMAFAFGGKIIRARQIMHGKTSPVYHDGQYAYKGLPSPLEGMRYHSLIVKKPVPQCFLVSARTKDGLVMGIRHKEYPHLEGIQFHPESIMTPSGKTILYNFIRQWT